jgi:hypothetical protein
MSEPSKTPSKKINAFGVPVDSSDEDGGYEEDFFVYDYYEDEDEVQHEESSDTLLPEKFKRFAVSSDKNREISPERYVEIRPIQINIDETLFTFIFSDNNGITKYVDENKITIPPNFCVSPLEYLNENNDFLKYRGCYLIITKETKSILLGFISYKIIINNVTNLLRFYLRSECIPIVFQGMRINSIIKQILYTTILQHYPVELFESHEIAIQKGKETNGSLNERYGFINIDSSGWMVALREDIEAKLREKPPLEPQLVTLNSRIVLHGGRKTNKRKTNKRKTNKRKTNKRKTNKRKTKRRK